MKQEAIEAVAEAIKKARLELGLSLMYEDSTERSQMPLVINEDAIYAKAAIEAMQPYIHTEPSEDEIESAAVAIHQCYYHPVDWGTKEWRNMFEREKRLAVSMSKAALTTFLEGRR